MQHPYQKTLNLLVPALFIEAIQDQFRSYDETRLRKPRLCPKCGDQNYRKHNIE